MEAHQRGRYRALPLIATPLEQEGGHGHPHGHNHSEIAVIRDNNPAFREKEEASTIELFYDLFFVANLTSFTTIHAIDDRTSKSSLSILLSIFFFFFFFFYRTEQKKYT